MKKIQAQNYVIKNGRYSDEAPLNSCYFVRYPHPNGAKVFFSGDIYDLVTKVFNFGRTKEGRRMWDENYSKSDFMESEIEFIDEEADNEWEREMLGEI